MSQRARRFVLGSIGLVACAASCEKPPVLWSEISYSNENTPRAETGNVSPGDSLACLSSIRIRVTGKDTFATWWSVRKDSSALLRFSRTESGRWRLPVNVDTTDVARTGCARPAPGLSVDPARRFVFIAYFLEQVTGPGAFFAHSMDSAGFHDPVAIEYGRRPSHLSIASSGDRVAVAYEEPNSERGQIWVALSGSMGHLFESRQPVSSGNEIASNPKVNLSGTKLDIQWSELVQSDSVARTRTASRTGTWK